MFLHGHMFSFLLCTFLEVKLLWGRKRWFNFFFLRICQTASRIAVPFYISTSNARGFQFLHTHPSQHLVIYVFLIRAFLLIYRPTRSPWQPSLGSVSVILFLWWNVSQVFCHFIIELFVLLSCNISLYILHKILY